MKLFSFFSDLPTQNFNAKIRATTIQIGMALSSGILPSEHKFNNVVHGVKESPQDTPRYVPTTQV